MSTDSTFVKSVSAKLGLSTWTADMSISDITSLLFDLVGTTNVRDITHFKQLLTNSVTSYMVDLNVLSSDEET